MYNNLKKHIESALKEYTSGSNYEYLIEAKTLFTELVGVVREDDPEYESIMNLFNDWYLFQFLSTKKTKTMIKEYVINKQLDPLLAGSLTNIHFSLLEHGGSNLGGSITVCDYFTNHKIKLAKDCFNLGLIKGDIFIGRIIKYDNEYYLLDGISLFPKEIKQFIKKQIKSIKKLKDRHKEIEYIFKLDRLKNKLKNYGHLDPVRFFEQNF